jgi:hypothetical protein
VYPNNLYLITLAELKAYTGITGTSNDTLLTNLIHSVSDAVEVYCDRRFIKWNWAQWFRYERELVLPEWPVNNILFIGTPVVSIVVTDSADKYNFNISQTNPRNPTIASGLTVTDGQTLTSTSFSFDTYTKLSTLKTAVEAAYPSLTLTLSSSPTYDYPNMNTQCLRTGTGLTWYGAIRQNVMYRIDDQTNRILTIPEDVTIQWNALDYWFEVCLLVIWESGYDSSSVPTGLKQTISNICRDYLSMSKIPSSGLVTSETLTNYSYTLSSSAKIFDIINVNYKNDLEFYRKKLV